MHIAFLSLILVISAFQTLRRGPGATFATVFLPVLLLTGAVKPIQLPVLPDITSQMAVSYGTLIGMVISGRVPGIRPHFIDGLILLMSSLLVVTAVVNGNFWTLVSATGNETLRWIVPYYMARLAFRDAQLRRTMAITLCWIAMAISAMGLIEFRLWPLFFSRTLSSLGLANVYNEMVQGRGGFFRAMATAEHPIDFGNVGLVLCGLIPALAVVGGLTLRDWRVRGAILASFLIVGEAISFSTFFGLGCAVALYAGLRYVRGSEWLLAPGVVVVAVAGFLFTASLLKVDLEAIRPAEGDLQFAGSYYIRVLIVQNSWNTFGKDAGFLGFGDNTITREALGLESVDNSYMLFLMRRGWVHLGLRVLLAVAIGVMGTLMLRRARGAARVAPAAMVAALLGTMVSMYTVWFGFVYAVLWTMMLAMMVTMQQMISGKVAPIAQPAPPPPDLDRGFEVGPRRPVVLPAPARLA